MSCIRVVMLIESLAGGGAELFTAALATALDPRRVDVTVCITRPGGGQRLRELRDAGIRTIQLDRRRTTSLGAWGPLLGHVRKERPHVLHGHMYGSNAWAVLLGRLTRVPVVVATEHSWSYEGKPIRRFVDGHVIGRLASAFVAVSRADATRMIELEGVPRDRVRLIETALPRSAEPSRDGAGFRARVGISPSAPMIGAVGSLVPAKAYDVLLEAFAQVRRSVPNARLVVAGEGPERSRLQATMDGLELNGSVALLGHRDDVSDLLDACDVYALSSDNEGSPLAVIEAMDAGCPIVATAVGGVPDLLDNGRVGRLVARRDAAAMGSAITALLEDRDDACRLGERANQRAATNYTLDHVARRWEALYEELVDGARR